MAIHFEFPPIRMCYIDSAMREHLWNRVGQDHHDFNFPGKNFNLELKSKTWSASLKVLTLFNVPFMVLFRSFFCNIPNHCKPWCTIHLIHFFDLLSVDQDWDAWLLSMPYVQPQRVGSKLFVNQPVRSNPGGCFIGGPIGPECII